MYVAWYAPAPTYSRLALRLVRPGPAIVTANSSAASSRAAAVILSLPIASRAWIVKVCVTPATAPASAEPLASENG